MQKENIRTATVKKSRRNVTAEFIEHYFDDSGRYVTTVWLEKSGQYSSAVSDLEPVTFGSLDEIRLYLKNELN